jgi:hypothetical protein
MSEHIKDFNTPPISGRKTDFQEVLGVSRNFKNFLEFQEFFAASEYQPLASVQWFPKNKYHKLRF